MSDQSPLTGRRHAARTRDGLVAAVRDVCPSAADIVTVLFVTAFIRAGCTQMKTT